MAKAAEMMGDRERLVAERDKWIRLFNRLEAAIAHHKRDTEWAATTDDADEALWVARDRIVRDAADRDG